MVTYEALFAYTLVLIGIVALVYGHKKEVIAGFPARTAITSHTE